MKKHTPEYWGRIGGKTRAKNLTPRQRSMSARKAAKARWARVAEMASLTARAGELVSNVDFPGWDKARG